MENQLDKTDQKIQNDRVAWEDFKHRLSQSPQDVQNRFNNILLEEQIRFLRENRGPAKISLENREHFLRLASSDRTPEEIREALKMERSWNAATSKDGRPPIGGAQDG